MELVKKHLTLLHVMSGVGDLEKKRSDKLIDTDRHFQKTCETTFRYPRKKLYSNKQTLVL